MESRKRVFLESSSSGSDPEVIDPPLVNRSSNSKAKGKQKEVEYHEVIDVDIDEDCDDDDVVLLEGKVEFGSSAKSDSNKVASNKKGKEIPIDLDDSFNGFNPGTNNFFDLDDYVLDDEYWALQSHFDSIGLPAGIEAPVPWLPDLVSMKKDKPAIPSVTSNTRLEAGVSQPNRADFKRAHTFYSSSKRNTAVGGQSTFFDPKPVPVHSKFTVHSKFRQTGSAYPPGMDTPNYKWYDQLAMSTADMLSGTGDIYSMNDMLVDQDASINGPSVESSSSLAKFLDGDVKKRYESFKKFDTVVDHSDHHFAKQSSAMTQPPKNWAKRIQEEWKILEKDLPDTIFVRVYESRMDLLRAVIIGAEGTPYHDGLFFFDVCFPSGYPGAPPRVHYHSGGLRINPNLYNTGKVCLSLLNTWSGAQNEKWIPGTSTMLQVLVSIQGLILNMKPYFNEPGYAHSSGSAHGEHASLQYNENTLILSLKTMVYTMTRPPKNFEDLVIGHFQHHVRDILMACKAYIEGVQVGCVVKGGLQDVDESNNSCSAKFKHDVASYIKILVAAFEKIGAKEAEEFLSLSVKESSLLPAPSPGPVFSPIPYPGLASYKQSAASYKPSAASYSSHGFPPPPLHYSSMSAAYKQHW